MATGPWHYAKAQQHLAAAASIETDGYEDSKSAWHQRQALAHATLATAAAFVDGPAIMRPEERDEWDRVTGRLQDPDYAAEQAAEAAL
jgi:hypothetical protein